MKFITSGGKEIMEKQVLSASEALERLKNGNRDYIGAASSFGEISPEIRRRTFEEGQNPYAVIVTCSDSRVIPESIFSAGIGELFVIRVAGNVIDRHQLGSIEYAADHLDTRLVVVLGHSRCGAVEAAIGGNSDGYIKFITEEIQKAIAGEKDGFRACCLNVQRSVSVIREKLKLSDGDGEMGLKVCGAMYHTDTGKVEFLEG